MNTAFIFPGQGSQAVSMGKDLYDNFKVAREVFQKVDEALSQSLSKIIFEGPIEDLTITENTQPALMAVSMAFLEVIKAESGQEIEGLCKLAAGHSVGEYSALAASGSISIEGVARILKTRGREMQNSCPKGKGAMAAILGLKIDVLEQIIEDTRGNDICDIANDNTESQIVISGDIQGVDNVCNKVKESGGKAIKLNVSGPFHSRLMDNASKEMEKHISSLDISPPRVPIILNVTSKPSLDPSEIKSALIRQVAGRVRWRESLLHMAQKDIQRVVEIGSGKVLTNMIKKSTVNFDLENVGNIDELKEFLVKTN
jgi:[acyl-carrier-protein] S-malonyltransferase